MNVSPFTIFVGLEFILRSCWHVEVLFAAKLSGQPIPRETAVWLAGLRAKLRERFAADRIRCAVDDRDRPTGPVGEQQREQQGAATGGESGIRLRMIEETTTGDLC